MDPTRREAEALLQDASGVASAVRTRAPREHPLYIATGLVFALAGLSLDLANDGGGAALVGTVAGVLLVAVLVATHLPYWRRHRQVRSRSTPSWVEWALAAWGAAALFGIGLLLDDSTGLAFTLGGVVGLVPSLLWAERLRRTA